MEYDTANDSSKSHVATIGSKRRRAYQPDKPSADDRDWLPMASAVNGKDKQREPRVEYRKGCPACEHSDPELERELRVFAELLLDSFLEKNDKEQQSQSVKIDNAP